MHSLLHMPIQFAKGYICLVALKFTVVLDFILNFMMQQIFTVCSIRECYS